MIFLNFSYYFFRFIISIVAVDGLEPPTFPLRKSPPFPMAVLWSYPLFHWDAHTLRATRLKYINNHPQSRGSPIRIRSFDGALFLPVGFLIVRSYQMETWCLRGLPDVVQLGSWIVSLVSPITALGRTFIVPISQRTISFHRWKMVGSNHRRASHSNRCSQHLSSRPIFQTCLLSLGLYVF